MRSLTDAEVRERVDKALISAFRVTEQHAEDAEGVTGDAHTPDVAQYVTLTLDLETLPHDDGTQVIEFTFRLTDDDTVIADFEIR